MIENRKMIAAVRNVTDITGKERLHPQNDFRFSISVSQNNSQINNEAHRKRVTVFKRRSKR
ncbi:MAG: hypothetical protein LBH60_06725, partial [Prevotellaceae bacterium]|nr:hypothetical protein [Prevotellaceae bacterium]